jgi:small GTP-binding protein
MAGQDRFEVIRSGFYRGSRAAALVYDVTEPDSFAHLERWRQEIQKAVEQQPFIVIGNKIDLERAQALEEAQVFAQSLGAAHLETSALDGRGVPALFEALAKLGLGV